jgi:acyl-CoA dehydrogenase
MFLQFSDEHEQLRATVRRFLAERAPLTWVRAGYEAPTHVGGDEQWKGLVELGLPGILVPEEAGGLGLGLVEMGVVLEELGRALHPGPFHASALAATCAVLEVGGPGDPLLPRLASGEATASLALLEPGRRHGWRRPDTRAESTAGGWRLQGAKAHVLDGATVDELLVTAIVPGPHTDGELGLFAVERAAVAADPEEVLDGTRKQATVRLDGVAARRVGEGDAGEALARALDRIRIGTVVEGVGTAQAAFERTLDHARSRIAFGKPIGAFQAVQHLCVAMYKAIEMSRAPAYYGMFADGVLDDAERRRVALIAKTYASDALVRVGNNAIQVHGGVGATWEHDIHLFYKRCLWTQQAYGASLEAADELADVIVGRKVT